MALDRRLRILPDQARKLALSNENLPLGDTRYQGVYWQGDNLEENYGSSIMPNPYQVFSETFATRGYLVRLPRVIRVFTAGNFPSLYIEHYRGLADHLDTTLNADLTGSNKICVTRGGDFASRNTRFVGQATPNPLEIYHTGLTADKIVGGEALILTFNWQAVYGEDYPDDTGSAGYARFSADYADWVPKRLRFKKIEVKFYQQDAFVGSGLTQKYEDLANDQVKGLGIYTVLGTPLTSLGWTYTSADLTSLLGYDQFVTIAQEFFGLI